MVIMMKQKTTDTQPFVENYLAFLLAKASHLVSGGFHQRLKSLGVSISAWRILAVLHDSERTVGELADLVLLNQPTLSKALDKMEKDGLVARRREEENRRVVMISITDKGMALVNQLIPLANRHEVQSFGHFSAVEKTQLVELLQKTIKGLSPEGDKHEL